MLDLQNCRMVLILEPFTVVNSCYRGKVVIALDFVGTVVDKTDWDRSSLLEIRRWDFLDGMETKK